MKFIVTSLQKNQGALPQIEKGQNKGACITPGVAKSVACQPSIPRR